MSTAGSDPSDIRAPRLGSSGRLMRADARRNREAILASARELLTAEPDTSTATIAKHAGVGVGTLFRHFATRLALVEALYDDELDKLDQLARDVASLPPWDALERWVYAFAEFTEAKRTTFGEVVAVFDHSPDQGKATRDRIDGTVAVVLDRAKNAGVVDSRLKVHDLVRLVGGVMLFPFGNDSRNDYLLELVLRGIRN